MNGYSGRIIEVDLSANSSKIRRVQEEFFKKFLGGVGIAAKIIKDNVAANVKSLSPNNVLVFAVGPFQSSVVPGSGKWVVASKSPQTEIWGESCGGGNWGPEFKRTGFEALIIKGKAKSPSYLWISEGEVEIKDADGIWGKTTTETESEIKADLGEKKASVACIGQAGERLVRFACVTAEHGFAGRSGMGAVMGSKNLKAVAVKGTQKIPVAEPEKLQKLNTELFKNLYEATVNSMRKHGTTAGLRKYIDRFGYGLRENWTKGTEKFSPILDGIDGDPFLQITVNPLACANCPISCHRHTKVDDPKKFAYDGTGPEYETIAMIGWLNMITDAKAVAFIGHLCNEYGMDTITTGSMIGFANECYQKELITKGDLDGIELGWGNADAAIELIHNIANRKGFGNVLAEGPLRAAEYVGHNADKLFMHSKGMDYAAHDPRGFFPNIINYATGPRGPCHERGFITYHYLGVKAPEIGLTEIPDRHSLEDAASFVIKSQNWATLFNCLVQCNYMVFGGYQSDWMTQQIDLLRYITGWDIDVISVMKIAERVFNLQRVINVSYGMSRKDDTAPPKVFIPQKEGKSAGKIPLPFNKTLLEYYTLRGWDRYGKPIPEKLAELDLTE